MATVAAKAEMDKAAMNRLNEAVKTLTERFEIEMPPARPVVRDPELARIYQREDMATLLEGLVKATKPEKLAESQPFAGAPGDYRPVAEREPATIVVGNRFGDDAAHALARGAADDAIRAREDKATNRQEQASSVPVEAPEKPRSRVRSPSSPDVRSGDPAGRRRR